jgi:hypothetical protein
MFTKLPYVIEYLYLGRHCQFYTHVFVNISQIQLISLLLLSTFIHFYILTDLCL